LDGGRIGAVVPHGSFNLVTGQRQRQTGPSATQPPPRGLYTRVRAQGGLHGHWNEIATQPIGPVPFQPLGILALYQSLKSKGGLAADKAAALRINLNVEGCCIVAAPVHAPSRAPLFHPISLSPQRSLVRDGQTSSHSPWLVDFHCTSPPPSPSPHANSFVMGTAVINLAHTRTMDQSRK